jgi:hypothetical protein
VSSVILRPRGRATLAGVGVGNQIATQAIGRLDGLVYGMLRSDLIIVAANAISLVLVAILLVFKLRESRRTSQSLLPKSGLNRLRQMQGIARTESERKGHIAT